MGVTLIVTTAIRRNYLFRSPLATWKERLWTIWKAIPAPLMPAIIIVIVNIFLLVVGCVMDLTPALLILGPILYPVSQRYGIDPIYFGVVMVTNLAIGLVTPPVGNCLYIATGVAKLPLTDVIREIWRFLFALIAILFLVTFFPPLITWLPSVFRT